jgi:hypothetical protein
VWFTVLVILKAYSPTDHLSLWIFSVWAKLMWAPSWPNRTDAGGRIGETKFNFGGIELNS